MLRLSCWALLGTLILASCRPAVQIAKPEEEKLIFLNNVKLEMGLLPEKGGRVVVLRVPGRKNILKEAADLWEADIEATPEANFQGIQGHIIWVGPQSEWWSQQDVNPERKEKKANWPPDPYLIYGNFEVKKNSGDAITLVSPDSPVTGLRLTKEFKLKSGGKVELVTTAENISDRTVKWDLWSNMRLNGIDRCFVPVDSNTAVRVEGSGDTAMPWKVEKGYFTFSPTPPADGQKGRNSKAFIDPSRGAIYGFAPEGIVIIEFEKIDSSKIHPEQAPVEIYNHTNINEGKHLLELEHHGAYHTLEPGQKMRLKEQWTILPCNGDMSEGDMLDFIENMES
ncbi:MAG: DUF4380 domain-containing protein [Candidatus Sumerlaeia bacterium]